MLDKNDLIRFELERQLQARGAPRAAMNRLRAAEKRRAEFSNRKDLDYVALLDDAAVLMVGQGEAAIIAAGGMFSHLGTDGLGPCIGLGIVAFGAKNKPIGAALSHVDAATSAEKTVAMLYNGLQHRAGKKHFAAFLCTGNLDASLMHDLVLALSKRRIEPKLDTQTSSLILDLRAGNPVSPDYVARGLRPSRATSLGFGNANYRDPAELPAATMTVNQMTAQRAAPLPAKSAKFGGKLLPWAKLIR